MANEEHKSQNQEQPIEFLFGEVKQPAAEPTAPAHHKSRRVLKAAATLLVCLAVVGGAYAAWPWASGLIDRGVKAVSHHGRTHASRTGDSETAGKENTAEGDASASQEESNGSSAEDTEARDVPAADSCENGTPAAEHATGPDDAKPTAAARRPEGDPPSGNKRSIPAQEPRPDDTRPAPQDPKRDTSEQETHLTYHEEGGAGWIAIKAAPDATCSILWMKGPEIVYKIRGATDIRNVTVLPKGKVVKRITVVRTGESTCTVAAEYANTIRWGWSYDQRTQSMVLRASLIDVVKR